MVVFLWAIMTVAVIVIFIFETGPNKYFTIFSSTSSMNYYFSLSLGTSLSIIALSCLYRVLLIFRIIRFNIEKKFFSSKCASAPTVFFMNPTSFSILYIFYLLGNNYQKHDALILLQPIFITILCMIIGFSLNILTRFACDYLQNVVEDILLKD